MTKTVLLTGYNGFLGRQTLRALEATGWEVVLAGRSAPDNREYRQVDLARPEDVLALGALPPPRAIVHLGANIGWPAKPDEDLYAPNVLATGILAGLSHRWGANLIFASAAIVHGARAERITPDSAINADTPYARSKLLGEQLIAASGARHCILRFGGLFGAHGPSHLGLNNAITAALSGTAPVRNGSGSARRNYLYVKDAAQVIVAALDYSLAGVHLVAGRDSLSIREMLDRLCGVMLPSAEVAVQDGGAARDQLISHSPALPMPRTFDEALGDIRRDNLECA